MLPSPWPPRPARARSLGWRFSLAVRFFRSPFACPWIQFPAFPGPPGERPPGASHFVGAILELPLRFGLGEFRQLALGNLAAHRAAGIFLPAIQHVPAAPAIALHAREPFLELFHLSRRDPRQVNARHFRVHFRRSADLDFVVGSRSSIALEFGDLAVSLGGEEFLDFFFEHVNVGGAQMFAINAAVTSNEEGGGHVDDPAVKLGELVVPQRHRVIHAEFFVERPHGINVVIKRDADDGQSLVAKTILQVHKPRYLDPARPAPGGPEIEQNNFASVIGQVELVAVYIGEGKSWSHLVIPARSLDRFIGRRHDPVAVDEIQANHGGYRNQDAAQNLTLSGGRFLWPCRLRCLLDRQFILHFGNGLRIHETPHPYLFYRSRALSFLLVWRRGPSADGPRRAFHDGGNEAAKQNPRPPELPGSQ